jgi:hypothetical protein
VDDRQTADPLLALCLAAAYLGQKQWKQAEEACRIAIAQDDKNADVYSNLVIALRQQCRPEEAIEAGLLAVRLSPDHAHAPLNLALAYEDVWQFNESLTILRQLVAHHPDNDRFRLPLGELELRMGIWETGWRNMHARFHLPYLHKQLSSREEGLGVPQWKGESLQGKRLGVWLEQGYGDSILLARFLPLIAEEVRKRGGKMVLGVFGPLVPMFKPLLAEDVELNIDFLDKTDYHLPFMSCCAAFGFTSTTLTSAPYMRASADRIAEWKARIARIPGRFHVGLAWFGNPDHERDAFRSISPDALFPILKTPEVVFHSLNPNASGDVANLRAQGYDVIDWSSDLSDFNETGALISALDLIITVDTSIGHLAGALGAPTLLMLDRVSSFIWANNEARTEWYDTVHLFRQTHIGQWNGVVKRVAAELTHRSSLSATPAAPLQGMPLLPASRLRSLGTP